MAAKNLISQLKTAFWWQFRPSGKAGFNIIATVTAKKISRSISDFKDRSILAIVREDTPQFHLRDYSETILNRF